MREGLVRTIFVFSNSWLLVCFLTLIALFIYIKFSKCLDRLQTIFIVTGLSVTGYDSTRYSVRDAID